MATEKQVLYMRSLAEYADRLDLLDPKKHGVTDLYQLTNNQVSEILKILKRGADAIRSFEGLVQEIKYENWGDID